MSSDEHKKDTIVLDHTKSPSYQRLQQRGDDSPLAKPTDQAGKLARATAAADEARVEAAERASRRMKVVEPTHEKTAVDENNVDDTEKEKAESKGPSGKAS